MTVRVTGGMVARNVLADLNRTTERLTQTQDRLSSGKRIERASDDPAGTARALQLREQLAGTRQHQRNAADGRAWTEATETALKTMTDVVHRVRELVVQGSSDVLSAQAREGIAIEVEQLAETLKEQANANYAGRHLFGGTLTASPPYPGGSDAFAGNGDPIAREIGPGVSVVVNVSVEGVLGSGQVAADDGLLHVLRDVAAHLRAADTAALGGTDLARLESGADGLLALRAANGSMASRLEAAGSRLLALEEVGLRTLSEVEDADIAETLIDLNTQTAAYQAALKAGANIVQSSLMDFLR